MGAKLEFSLPPIPEPAGSNHFHGRDEIPTLLIPAKVHSVTGSISNPDSLTSRDVTRASTLARLSQDEPAPSIVLDFGVAVAGIPFVCVQRIDTGRDKAVVDFAVSEGYNGITRSSGDGPYPFSAGGDTARRVRFRLNHTGFHQAQCVQGSQRWMRLSLVSQAPCSVSISLAGFIPTTSNIPLDQLPGYFQCSDAYLNNIWEYGARTLQLNSVPTRSIPPPWQVSGDMGVLIDSQRCNAYSWGSRWTDYELQFSGMVLEGGLAWNVRVPAGMPSVLFQIVLDGQNTRVEQWYGYFNKPQTTLRPKFIASVEITSVRIVPGEWFQVNTVCKGYDPIRIRINGVEIGNFKQGSIVADPFSALAMPPESQEFPFSSRGSVGIGAGEDQLCRFRDLSVRAIPSREVLYESGLNTPAVLSDFGIGWNQLPYIFDGAKRDRYPWTADIIVGGRALYYSTAAAEHVRGNIIASMLRGSEDSDATPLLSGGGPAGRDLTRGPRDGMFNVLTVNYSLYLILVIYDYWMYTADHTLLQTCWERIKRCVNFLEESVNDKGLLNVTGREALDYDYYNGLQQGVSTKRNVLYVAALRACASIASSPAIDDGPTKESYLSLATRTAEAIQSHCFNADTGHYNITDSRRLGFQQETHAHLIIHDLLPRDRLEPILEKFTTLTPTTHNGSPLSFSPDTPDVPPVISPIMSAFHVQAAVHAGRYDEAEHVLRTVWQPMADEANPHFTGTTWEFLTPEGAPYKEDFCSYAQLFSVGPTFILSRYVLGVDPVEPGYKRFIVSPKFTVKGLEWVQGRVPTPTGQPIVVRWQLSAAGWKLGCHAPAGLLGTVVVPEDVWARKTSVWVAGAEHMGSREIPLREKGSVDIEVHF
ncbi:Six-hairpin glycosidase [Achaetomium macrosporum]|uniref:Six-hairpin glycosidase n=1 Tax=Achaetomium macrosporum TaxID=79813 RepID=A0AAN7C2W9_9PEZI|nr:Six-hairpin glycosidase [Achaetomium macrosporum]